MDRRRFLLTSLAGALAAPLAAGAQQKVLRIGVLVPPGPRPSPFAEAFRHGLQDLGYVEGKSLIFEFRLAREPREQAALISELVNLNVDVLVTWTTPAAVAAARATSTIPVVVMTGDPIRTGLATSLARPGGNVTGIAILVDTWRSKSSSSLNKRCLPPRAPQSCGIRPIQFGPLW